MKLPRAPSFWWHQSLLGYALAPLGVVYGRIAVRRMAEPGQSINVPVICIGNLVLGGAGKTPTVLEIARICRQLGYSPGFLSRGYGGTIGGPVLVSHAAHRAGDVGDEPLLLAQHAPTVVAANRVDGAKLLAGLGADIVLMDDGFQNPSLEKDLSILVVDASRGIGNGLVFPAGPLRAPLVAQMRHADALVLLDGSTESAGRLAWGIRAASRAGLPVLRARTEAVRRRGLRRRPYLAFAGIGEPEKFYASLKAAGAEVGFTMSFADHHPFSDGECEAILAEAKQRDLVPITTEKDRMRLIGRDGAAGRLAAAAETFPIRIAFEEPLRIAALVRDAATAHGGAYRRSAAMMGAAAAARA